MDKRKSLEEMNVYLRSVRPEVEFLDFDRMVRLVLMWFDTHRVKEVAVFKEGEGNEYEAFVGYLTMSLGETPTFPEGFVAKLFDFARATR